MLAQYTEMKQDLADFEQAFKDGHITEDQLAAAKEDIAVVEQNMNRLSYIMFLLEAPNRDKKQDKYKRANKKLLNDLVDKKADKDSVIAENKSALDHLRAELKKLTKAK